MGIQAVFKKGSAHRIRVAVTSPAQARRLSRAIRYLQRYPLSVLIKNGMVKKLKAAGKDNVYAFSAGAKERIVFSPVNNKIVIHDIVDLSDGHSVRSLLRKIPNTTKANGLQNIVEAKDTKNAVDAAYLREG